MISPDSIKLLEELGKTQFGKALREFLDDKKTEIGDITKSKSWEETLGRQHALTLIKDLFYFMKEKEPPVDKKKNPYV